MIGQFHPECAAPAARNGGFPVNRAPIPLLVFRRMAVHDILFLAEDPQWFHSYRTRFAGYYDTAQVREPHLRGAYAEALERHSVVPNSSE